MSRTSKSLLFGGVSLALIACVTSAVTSDASIEKLSAATQVIAPSRPPNRTRNLQRQPEALRVSRRLGKRFGPMPRGATAATGRLIIGGTEQPLALTRRQAGEGETVELLLASSRLTWSADEGTKAELRELGEAERLLFERLIYDSPDYFVLAQLRGASYFTVARNVRPLDAPDNYVGPVWNVVRVDEPQTAEALRPQISWRLFYINSQTGLIDRIVSQFDGDTIEAEIRTWDETTGENVPAHITWSKGGQVVMSYQAIAVFNSE